MVESIMSKIKVEFIWVMDMKGIRYSHPNKKKVGEKFVVRDEVRVLTKGEYNKNQPFQNWTDWFL